MGKVLKFSGNNIDRLEVERRNENWVSEKINDPNSKVLVYNRSKILVKKILYTARVQAAAEPPTVPAHLGAAA